MDNEKILQEYSDEEKGAYLGAIASIATADRQASEEEMEYLDTLADTAGLSAGQKQAVAQIAQGISPEDLKHCLDILKGSDLRYSFITDVIAFAKSDSDYSDAEKNNIDKMAEYLGISGQQVNALHQFVTTAAGSNPEEVMKPGFLDSLGLGDIFKGSGSSGAQSGGMLKNIIGMAGPMILGALFSSGSSNRGSSGAGGGLGGMLGSVLGSGGSTGGTMGNLGGLGGLFSMLGGGGGGFKSSGGLLSSIFGK